MVDLEKLKADADRARKHAEELKRAVEAEENRRIQDELVPLRDLANKAHSNLCSYNHSDGCGWGYEEDGKNPQLWDGAEHQRWLKKIQSVIKEEKYTKLDSDKLNKILDLITEMKAVHPNAMHILQKIRSY